MNMLMLPSRQIFICDTYVNRNPPPEDIAEMTLLAAEEVRRFGLAPVVALLSHSSFGSSTTPEAQLMRDAWAILLEHDPELVVGWRDARRRGSVEADPGRRVSRIAAAGRCQPADHAAASMPPTLPTTCSRSPPAAA